MPIGRASGSASATSRKGIFVDGESRGEALLTNLEQISDTEYDQLVKKRVAVHIIHGITDPKVIAKYFADVNGPSVARIVPHHAGLGPAILSPGR